MEVLRWFSLCLSLMGLGGASYSLWLSMAQNKRLLERNSSLMKENFDLRMKLAEYEVENG